MSYETVPCTVNGQPENVDRYLLIDVFILRKTVFLCFKCKMLLKVLKASGLACAAVLLLNVGVSRVKTLAHQLTDKMP